MDHGLRAENRLLPLGGYTAIVGPNDSGKTGWLRSIEHAINGPPPSYAVHGELPLGPNPMLGCFLRLSDAKELAATVDLNPWQISDLDDLPARAQQEVIDDVLPMTWEDGTFWWAIRAIAGTNTPPSVPSLSDAGDWLGYLNELASDPARALLSIAISDPLLVRVYETNEYENWDESCWLCVDGTNRTVASLLEQLGLPHSDPQARWADPLGLFEGIQAATESAPTDPVPIFPIPGTIALDRLRAFVPSADPEEIHARFTDNATDIEPARLSAELNASLPPIVRSRYQLVAEEPRFAPPVLTVHFKEPPTHRRFDLADVAHGWRLWFGVALEIAISRLAYRETPLPSADLLLIDEPEQHLHAEATRSISRWLAESTSTRFQTVVATHAPRFAQPIGASSRVVQLLPRTSEVDRHGQTLPSRVVARETPIAEFDELGRQMGWDSGELVAFYATVLFVEGRVDELLLNELFAIELRAAGILVTPLHGLRKVRGIPHSRVLTRLLPGLRVALMVDAITESKLDELQRMNDEELTSIAKTEGGREPGWVAQLLLELPANRRSDLRVVSHGAEDVLALLDDEILTAELRNYPGRAASAQALEAKRRSSPKTWKVHMRESYRLPTEPEQEDRFVRRAIDSALSRDARPPELLELIGRVAAT